VEYLAARERWEAATKQLLTHETETAALITKVGDCCYYSTLLSVPLSFEYNFVGSMKCDAACQYMLFEL
jgi:hypothetical protein